VKFLSGCDQIFGRYGKRFGCPEQIGFVVGEKIERRGENPRISEPRTQRIGIETRQLEVSIRTFVILQHPAERREGEGRGARRSGAGRSFVSIRDCYGLLARLP